MTEPRFWVLDDPPATDWEPLTSHACFEAGLVDEEAGGIIAYFLGYDRAVEVAALLNGISPS